MNLIDPLKWIFLSPASLGGSGLRQKVNTGDIKNDVLNSEHNLTVFFQISDLTYVASEFKILSW